MALPITINGCDRGQVVKVSTSGELAVAPLYYDESEFHDMSLTGTAYNFYKPLNGKHFVITGMRVKAGAGVSPITDALVTIYEGETEDTLVESRVLHKETLIKGEGVALIPMRTLVSEDVYVNAMTDDANIFMTIWGYYVSNSFQSSRI